VTNLEAQIVVVESVYCKKIPKSHLLNCIENSGNCYMKKYFKKLDFSTCYKNANTKYSYPHEILGENKN
jgi:hypothetical protein